MSRLGETTGQKGCIGPKPEDPSPAGQRSVIGPKPEDPHSIDQVTVPRKGAPNTKLPTPGGAKP
jgi:hypothetical protein